jgi:predicted neutral ceramidase superfamily lipid hydrolase
MNGELDNITLEENNNIFLANLISIFHVFVILFILIIPFSNIPALLIIHIMFAITLLVHWYANNNACSLTFLEAKLRGLEVDKSFTYQFIAPMYEMSQTKWSTICYVVTIILMCISFYYLYNSSQLDQSIKCFQKKQENLEWKELSFYKKTGSFFNCFKNLLVIQ